MISWESMEILNTTLPGSICLHRLFGGLYMLIPLSVAIHNSPLLCSQNAFTLSSAKDGSSPLRCLSKVVLVPYPYIVFAISA